MKSTVKLVRRFFIILVVSFTILIIVNIALFILLTYNEMNSGSPWTAAEKVSQSLISSENGFILEAGGVEALETSGAWAILIENSSGHVIWSSDKVPGNIPESFTIAELSAALRGYIADYPTTSCGHGDDLVILGFPKTSLWKLMWNTFDYDLISNAPKFVLTFFAFNIIVILLIYAVAVTGVLKSVTPIIRGIESLPDRGDVYVRESGLFSQVAASINRASEKLRVQEYELKKKDMARTDWIAGVSHDIRTPLTMVMGNAGQLADDGSLQPHQYAKVQVILSQSQRIRDLISDLNLVSKLEYDMQPLNVKKIDAVSLLRGIAAEQINSSLDPKYSIIWNTPDGLSRCSIEADEPLLKRAIINLISNSQIHNPQGCSISVSVNVEDMCVISVRDDGIGVDPEKLKSLNRAPQPFTSVTGHGLGLELTKKIAAAHKGRCVFSVPEDGGFCTRIYIPLACT